MNGLYNSERTREEQQSALTSGEVPIAVYGLGKMGLPMAAVYAERSGNVTGVDIDPDVVERLNRGESHIEREPGLDDLVADLVEHGELSATTDAHTAAEAASIHIVIVPTQLTDDNTPDLSALEAAVDSIGAGLSPGDTVFVECTVPPGTCREIITPRLESVSGLERGEFGVAFCPERTSSGTALFDIRGKHPKVVGGIDEESTRVAELVYGEFVDNEIHAMKSATTAEAVKLFEGVYRDVNIALANELARLAESLDIDALDAIEAASATPYCHIHSPGPGVGGHCIPWYPHFLMSQTDEPAPLMQTARDVNESMPAFTVEKTAQELAANGVDIDGSSVLVLGVTYRPGVKETRATPAKPIIEGLSQRGATVYGCDPMVDPADFGAEPVSVDDLQSCDVDAVVMVTPHEEFLEVDWTAFDDSVLVDGRDTLGHLNRPRYTIGRGRTD
ncbi:nucleotide sugar dehydrogenase [Halomarina litorea]|uniref:nucleotide sugar dehydrogenase n=1 Tax=Halomarina litorea TaxID=2961595 RepID=UPI0020C37F14|nr:nucleotide sugar dehydrogenase [Halomarina sp. BCD28]